MTTQAEHQHEQAAAAPRRPLAVDLAIAVGVIAVVVGAIGFLVRGMVGPQPGGTLAPDRAQPRAVPSVTTAGIAATTSAPTSVPVPTGQAAATTAGAESRTATSQPVGAAPLGGNALATPPPATPAVGQPPTPAIVPTAASPGSARPAAGATVEPLPASVDPNLAAEVINAYLRYWDVRVQAMADPTSTELNLESVMSGEELAGARKTLAEYAAQGRAYQTEVDHQLTITSLQGQQAIVLDHLGMRSQRVDPTTGAAITGMNPTEERQSTLFTLQYEGGLWRVVREEAVD